MTVAMMDRTKQMKALIDQGWTLQKVADQFGLSRQRVGQIVGNVGRRATVQRIVADNIDWIMTQWEQGVSFRAIAREYGVSASRISAVLRIPSNYHGTVVHGTRNAYLYHKCRCQECTAAGQLYVKQRNANLRKCGLCIKCRRPSTHWICSICKITKGIK